MFKKNFRKIIYKVLTAISCSINALNSFTNAHYKTHFTFSQQFYAIGRQILVKPQKENQNFIKNYKSSESKP